MKEIKSFYVGALLLVTVVFCSCFIGQKLLYMKSNGLNWNNGTVFDTDFGSFLAGQHALFVNDFESASKLLGQIKDDTPLVQQSKILVSFLNGNMPEGVNTLANDKDLSNRLIYDAYLINNDKWADVYKRHSKDSSLLFAPIRVFSAVKQGKTQEAIKYVNSLSTNDSWKAFMRGQIAVLNNDVDKAAREFADVHPDFMNINDYMYLMSFYRENGMDEDMDILRKDFTEKPGGMFVLNYPNVPDWSQYAGHKNNIIFGIIQTISHTQVMIFTDLSLLMLRFADIISVDSNKDALNYYLGQYYFYNNGDYEKHFNAISDKNPLYVFAQMKITEKNGDLNYIKKIARKNPLFIPAVNIMILNDIKDGNKNSALRWVNRALKQKGISDPAKIYFLKQRANIYLMFNKPNRAQKDIKSIFDMDDRLTSDMLLLQARCWLQQNRNLTDAYNYAMSLVKRNTSDILAWDLVGQIVAKNEGVGVALELLERVGEIAVTTSSLYEHLGDLYIEKGEKEKAKKSYLRALDLSDDGLVVVPFVKKKLRKAK